MNVPDKKDVLKSSRHPRRARPHSLDLLTEAAHRVRLKLPMSTSQFAAFIGVSKRTVSNWITAGKFREVIYISQTDLRIPADVVSEFLNHRTVRSVRTENAAQKSPPQDEG